MAFKKNTAPELTAESPEKLFPLLPRTGKNRDGLWSQQVDLLREYVAGNLNAKDLSIELPTGTGKTLTGLLVADWRRRERRGRTIYACPTKQLVRQVVSSARAEGIPVVDLSGPATNWDAADRFEYERGRATAVVAYSSVFNVAPKLITADLLIFDDAHAGEQYVSQAYTVQVHRRDHAGIWEDIVEALRPALNDERHRQLTQTSPGGGTRDQVDAMFLALRDDWLAPLGRALERLETEPDQAARSASFAYRAIARNLSACTLYLSWDKVEVRPSVPPTFENALFASANQRLYLSATLGAAGELERAFGRPNIKRLALPESAPTPKSGRRFLVFPTLVPDCDPNELTRELLSKFERAVVITPSESRAKEAERELAPSGWKVFSKNDVEASFDEFAETKQAVTILANRYDGIDLPGSTCRAVALHGFPGVTNLQERFYATRAKSTSVSDERVRSRIVQGTGRCTRGPRDWSLVIIADPETTTYLSRDEYRTTLDPDLQAEVLFGLDQSVASVDDVRENVDMFLEQGASWHEDAEPVIAELRAQAVRMFPAPAAPLAAGAKLEVEALEKLWHEDWKAAAEGLSSAADALAFVREAKGYQATLLFQAAVLMDRAGRQQQQEELARVADALAEKAIAAANPSMWMNAYLPFDGRGKLPDSAALQSAVSVLTESLDRIGSPTKLQGKLNQMHAGLGQTQAKAYEAALTELGKFLGADAFKPSGDGRTDSAWCWGNDLWITLEAKSEHKPAGVISIDDVRQINAHLDLVAKDRSAAVPSSCAAVLVSPREAVHPDALSIAAANTWRVTLTEVQSLAEEVDRLWARLMVLRNIVDPVERAASIADALRDVRLTPEDVLDRLTLTPLGGAATLA